MNLKANSVYSRALIGALLLLLLTLAGCALQGQPARPAVYDFGPGPLASVPGPGAATLPTLVIDVTDASAALDSTAVLYRLAYADEQQLRPYSQARWSMTPSQLLRQRLRTSLGRQRTLLNAGDGAEIAAATPPKHAGPLRLHLELEEFSQLFTAPDASVGLLRLRATVAQPSPAGEKWVAQRSIIVQRPAPSADAAGGVRALTAASDAALQELGDWLQTLERP